VNTLQERSPQKGKRRLLEPKGRGVGRPNKVAGNEKKRLGKRHSAGAVYLKKWGRWPPVVRDVRREKKGEKEGERVGGLALDFDENLRCR